MGWVRLDDSFYDHEKFARVGPLGLAQWTVGVAWCNRNLSDGVIPRTIAKRLLDWDGIAYGMTTDGIFGQADEVDGIDVSELLVECGLWEHEGDDYRVHDYHDHQPSAEEVRAKRLKTSEERVKAGRKGGQITASRNGTSDQANQQTAEQSASSGQATGAANVQPQPQPQVVNNSRAKRDISLGEEFTKVWGHYPKKVERKGALRAFIARRKAGASFDDLLTATQHYSIAMRGKEAKYVKYGKTFFGPDEPWRDYLDSPVELHPVGEVGASGVVNWHAK